MAASTTDATAGTVPMQPRYWQGKQGHVEGKQGVLRGVGVSAVGVHRAF